MNNEGIALDHLEQGRFMEAVYAWRDFAVEKGYLGGSLDASCSLSVRVLEARLIYLSMLRQDDVFQALVDRYREWLLDQTAHIETPTELSLERFALPDSMRVGHPEIDRDHETLFAYANDIRDALRLDDRIQAAKLADVLIDEIIDHFKREEMLLIEAGYPDADTHANYHEVLRSKAEEVRNTLFGLLSGGPQAVVTFDMLISFLVNDPIAADIDFREFFRHRGIDRPASVASPVHSQSIHRSADQKK